MNPPADREQEVLIEALSGAPVAEIAAETHARSSAEAAVIARDRGWL